MVSLLRRPKYTSTITSTKGRSMIPWNNLAFILNSLTRLWIMDDPSKKTNSEARYRGSRHPDAGWPPPSVIKAGEATIEQSRVSAWLLLNNSIVSARLLMKPRKRVSRLLQRLSCEIALHQNHIHVSDLCFKRLSRRRITLLQDIYKYLRMKKSLVVRGCMDGR